jgi:hypothetical protein
MNEDNLTLEQPAAEAVEPKPEPKKPSFKRAVPVEKPEQQPSFKRAKTDSKPAAATAASAPVSPVAPPQAKPVALKVDLKDILALIEIQKYVEAIVNGNQNITDKAKMRDLSSIKLLLDRKIVNMLVDEDFKSFVNFQDANEATLAARKANTLTNHPLRSQLYG